MFNPVFTDPNNALLQDRLSRVAQDLRRLSLPTAEDYQAEIYSRINAVLAIDNQMTPLKPVGSEGPAVVGDVSDNYTILNNDAEDIAKELLRVEDLASSLFNLAATSQNQLRQQIRELAFESNNQRYTEGFLNANQIQTSTATLDFNAGLATNALLDETDLTPQITIGTGSAGTLSTGSSTDALSDNRVDTSMIWLGPSVELILTFDSPEIVNRMKLNMDDYGGLEIGSMFTSPDGTLIEDVLGDLGVTRLLLDGTAGKFSGDVIIDFPPRHVRTMRILILDRVGIGHIALRDLSLSIRRYQSTGQLTSNPINHPADKVLFSSQENVFAPLVSISHQISFDGVSFSSINPNDTINIASTPYYYRAILERSTGRFDPSQGPLLQSPLDPVSSPNYQVVSTTTVPLGNGILERTIALNNITGPIVIRENPLPNTVQVQEGAVLLSAGNGDYTLSNNTISFPNNVIGVTVTYQTTSLGSAALKDREEFYTPLLYEVQFERA